MDCLEGMKELPDNSIDLVLTDPPYGTTNCSWDSIIPLETMWEQLKRITKDNSAFVFTASQPFTTKLISSNIKMFKYCWVWEKNRGSNFGAVRFMPMKEHEDIVVFGFGKINYHPIIQQRKGKGRDRVKYKVIARTKTENYASSLHGERDLHCKNERCPSSIIKINTVGNGTLHPTQKPIALMEYLIKTYSGEKDIVLDFCMGSGTTALACLKLNRRFIGYEISEEYCKIAEKRIEGWRNQTRLPSFDSSPHPPISVP
jgi:site-specific DNA-methyltransferase (adenine-specific)